MSSVHGQPAVASGPFAAAGPPRMPAPPQRAHRTWRREPPAKAAEHIERFAHAQLAGPPPSTAGGSVAIPGRAVPGSPPKQFRSSLNELEVQALQDEYDADPFGERGSALTVTRTLKCWALLERLGDIRGPSQGLLRKMLAMLKPAVFTTDDTDEEGNAVPHFAVIERAEARVRKERDEHNELRKRIAQLEAENLGLTAKCTELYNKLTTEGEAWESVARVHDDLSHVLKEKDERIATLERRVTAALDEVEEVREQGMRERQQLHEQYTRALWHTQQTQKELQAQMTVSIPTVEYEALLLKHDRLLDQHRTLQQKYAAEAKEARVNLNMLLSTQTDLAARGRQLREVTRARTPRPEWEEVREALAALPPLPLASQPSLLTEAEHVRAGTANQNADRAPLGGRASIAAPPGGGGGGGSRSGAGSPTPAVGSRPRSSARSPARRGAGADVAAEESALLFTPVVSSAVRLQELLAQLRAVWAAMGEHAAARAYTSAYLPPLAPRGPDGTAALKLPPYLQHDEPVPNQRWTRRQLIHVVRDLWSKYARVMDAARTAKAAELAEAARAEQERREAAREAQEREAEAARREAEVVDEGPASARSSRAAAGPRTADGGRFSSAAIKASEALAGQSDALAVASPASSRGASSAASPQSSRREPAREPMPHVPTADELELPMPFGAWFESYFAVLAEVRGAPRASAWAANLVNACKLHRGLPEVEAFYQTLRGEGRFEQSAIELVRLLDGFVGALAEADAESQDGRGGASRRVPLRGDGPSGGAKRLSGVLPKHGVLSIALNQLAGAVPESVVEEVLVSLANEMPGEPPSLQPYRSLFRVPTDGYLLEEEAGAQGEGKGEEEGAEGHAGSAAALAAPASKRTSRDARRSGGAPEDLPAAKFDEGSTAIALIVHAHFAASVPLAHLVERSLQAADAGRTGTASARAVAAALAGADPLRPEPDAEELLGAVFGLPPGAQRPRTGTRLAIDDAVRRLHEARARPTAKAPKGGAREKRELRGSGRTSLAQSRALAEAQRKQARERLISKLSAPLGLPAGGAMLGASGARRSRSPTSKLEVGADGGLSVLGGGVVSILQEKQQAAAEAEAAAKEAAAAAAEAEADGGGGARGALSAPRAGGKSKPSTPAASLAAPGGGSAGGKPHSAGAARAGAPRRVGSNPLEERARRQKLLEVRGTRSTGGSRGAERRGGGSALERATTHAELLNEDPNELSFVARQLREAELRRFKEQEAQQEAAPKPKRTIKAITKSSAFRFLQPTARSIQRLKEAEDARAALAAAAEAAAKLARQRELAAAAVAAVHAAEEEAAAAHLHPHAQAQGPHSQRHSDAHLHADGGSPAQHGVRSSRLSHASHASHASHTAVHGESRGGPRADEWAELDAEVKAIAAERELELARREKGHGGGSPRSPGGRRRSGGSPRSPGRRHHRASGGPHSPGRHRRASGGRSPGGTAYDAENDPFWSHILDSEGGRGGGRRIGLDSDEDEAEHEAGAEERRRRRAALTASALSQPGPSEWNVSVAIESAPAVDLLVPPPPPQPQPPPGQGEGAPAAEEQTASFAKRDSKRATEEAWYERLARSRRLQEDAAARRAANEKEAAQWRSGVIRMAPATFVVPKVGSTDDGRPPPIAQGLLPPAPPDGDGQPPQMRLSPAARKDTAVVRPRAVFPAPGMGGQSGGASIEHRYRLDPDAMAEGPGGGGVPVPPSPASAAASFAHPRHSGASHSPSPTLRSPAPSGGLRSPAPGGSMRSPAPGPMRSPAAEGGSARWPATGGRERLPTHSESMRSPAPRSPAPYELGAARHGNSFAGSHSPPPRSPKPLLAARSPPSPFGRAEPQQPQSDGQPAAYLTVDQMAREMRRQRAARERAANGGAEGRRSESPSRLPPVDPPAPPPGRSGGGGSSSGGGGMFAPFREAAGMQQQQRQQQQQQQQQHRGYLGVGGAGGSASFAGPGRAQPPPTHSLPGSFTSALGGFTSPSVSLSPSAGPSAAASPAPSPARARPSEPGVNLPKIEKKSGKKREKRGKEHRHH